MTIHVSPADIKIMFAGWIIPHSRAEATMQMMEELREQKRKLPFGFEARAAHVLAPSQSGKTHAVYHNYFQNFVIPQCRESGEYGPDVSDEIIKRLQRKVVYVKVPSEYLGSFALALLKGLGDPRPGRGSVDARIERAETLMASFGTELLVVDSFDNLTRHDSTEAVREADRTQARLRLILERGMPMLFVGVPTARASILNEEQLSHRIEEIEFNRLADPEDMEEFAGYLVGLDLLMAENKIFPQLSDLLSYIDPMFIACRGRYGVTSNLIRDAAIYASREQSTHLLERHLSKAVDSYLARTPRVSAIADYDLDDLNPFSGKRVPYKGALDG